MKQIGFFDSLKKIDKDAPFNPVQFAQKFANLSPPDQIKYVGACLSANTNLGLAYAHVFRILAMFESGIDLLSRSDSETPCIDLVQMFDSFSEKLQTTLENIYETVDQSNIHVDIKFRHSQKRKPVLDGNGKRGFRLELEEWQRVHLLHNSHYLFSNVDEGIFRFMIPLRALFILDRILSHLIAQPLDIPYTEMDDDLSIQLVKSSLDWDGKIISVEIADKFGKMIEANWKPPETSVIRIRKFGTDEWSPGFETPFSFCTFVGIAPETDYEIQKTRKDELGDEGEPEIEKIKHNR